MATPFEDFVNTELPKRIYIDLPPSGNLDAGKVLLTTGVGLEVELGPNAATGEANEPETVVIRGDWDASTGVYPAGQLDGDAYRVSIAGSVGPFQYRQDDFLIFWNGNPYRLLGRNTINPTVILEDAAVFTIELTENSTHKHFAYITRAQAEQLVEGTVASIDITSDDATVAPLHTHTVNVTYSAGNIVPTITDNHGGVEDHSVVVVGTAVGIGEPNEPGTMVLTADWDASTGVYPVGQDDGDTYRVIASGDVGPDHYEAGDTLYFYNAEPNRIIGENSLVNNTDNIFILELSDNGTHNHIMTMSVTEAQGLISGDVPNVIKNSTTNDAHNHELTITFNTTTKEFEVVIGSNHIGAEHVLTTVGFGKLGGPENGFFDYQGTYDASIGTYPGGPNADGDLYRISVAGVISAQLYSVDDHIYYYGGSWYYIPGPNSSGTGSIQWIETNANTTAAAGENHLVDTSGGPITIDLPASPSQGDRVVFAPALDTYSTNNLTIGRNGENISDVAADLVISTDGRQVELVYTTTSTIGWVVLERGDTIVSYDIADAGVATIIELQDNGIGHNHFVVLTDQQAQDLVSGAVSFVIVESSQASAHTHDVTIAYVGGDYVVTNIADNHVGNEHVPWFVGWRRAAVWTLFDGVTVTSPYAPSVDDNIIADTSGGPLTVTLPAAPLTGTKILITYAAPGQFFTNSLTIAANGNNIAGQVQDVVLDEDISVELIYMDAVYGWALITHGETLFVQNTVIDAKTDALAFYVVLEDNGVGHTHYIFVSDDQAASLISGEETQLLLTSTNSVAHTHDIILQYNPSAEFFVFSIATNHLGQEHTARIYGWNENETWMFLDSGVDVSPYNAQSDDNILIDTTSAVFTINLPASPTVNDTVVVGPSASTFITNSLFVNGNGNNIAAQGVPIEINENSTYEFIFAGGTVGWSVVPRGGSLFFNTVDRTGQFQWILFEGVTVTSPYAAGVNENILADTTASPLTVQLPAFPGVNDTIVISPATNNFDVNNLTIDNNGNNISGVNDTVILNLNIAVELIFVGGSVGWALNTRGEPTIINSGLSGENWIDFTATGNGLSHTSYFVDTTTGPLTMFLPVSPNHGDNVKVHDAIGNFGTNSLTISGNGLNINGSPTYVMTTNDSTAKFVYSSTQNEWRLTELL